MRDSKERLRDMLEAIDNIDRYAIQGSECGNHCTFFLLHFAL